MPRFNVKLDNGNWRVFSDSVDDYISEEMTFEELKEYRRSAAIAKADEETDSLLQIFPLINRITQKDAEERIAQRKSFERSNI